LGEIGKLQHSVKRRRIFDIGRCDFGVVEVLMWYGREVVGVEEEILLIYYLLLIIDYLPFTNLGLLAPGLGLLAVYVSLLANIGVLYHIFKQKSKKTNKKNSTRRKQKNEQSQLILREIYRKNGKIVLIEAASYTLTDIQENNQTVLYHCSKHHTRAAQDQNGKWFVGLLFSKV